MFVKFRTKITSSDGGKASKLSVGCGYMIKQIIQTGIPSFPSQFTDHIEILGWSGAAPTNGVYVTIAEPASLDNMSTVPVQYRYKFRKRHHQNSMGMELSVGWGNGTGFLFNVGSDGSTNWVPGTTEYNRSGPYVSVSEHYYEMPYNGDVREHIEGTLIITDKMIAFALYSPNSPSAGATLISSMLTVFADQEYIPDIDDELNSGNAIYSPQYHFGVSQYNNSGVVGANVPAWLSKSYYQPQRYDWADGIYNNDIQSHPYTNEGYFQGYFAANDTSIPDTSPIYGQPVYVYSVGTPLIPVHVKSNLSSPIPRKLHDVYRVADDFTSIPHGDTLTVDGVTYALITGTDKTLSGTMVPSSTVFTELTSNAVWAFAIQ